MLIFRWVCGPKYFILPIDGFVVSVTLYYQFIFVNNDPLEHVQC